MMNKKKPKFSNELKKTSGNFLFSIAAALLIFVLIDSMFDESKSVGIVIQVVYILLSIVFIVCGGIVLNSINKHEDDKVRYIQYVRGIPTIMVKNIGNDNHVSTESDTCKKSVGGKNNRKKKQ